MFAITRVLVSLFEGATTRRDQSIRASRESRCDRSPSRSPGRRWPLAVGRWPLAVGRFRDVAQSSLARSPTAIPDIRDS